MLINADSMKKETFGRIEDNSIQAIITSPPYYLQRDYGHHEQIGLEADIGGVILIRTEKIRTLSEEVV